MGGTRVRGRAFGWTGNPARRRPDPPAHTAAGEAHGRENSCGLLKECVATKGLARRLLRAARLGSWWGRVIRRIRRDVGWLWWHLFDHSPS